MAKNEAKIRFTAETSEFNSDIKKSNQTMAELRAEFKLNEEQMETNGESAEGLQKRQELLEQQLSASQKRTEALSKKMEKAVEIYGENSDEVSKLRVQLLNAQTAEQKIQQQINKCSDALEDNEKAAKDAGDGFTVMKGAMANLISSGIQAGIGKLKELSSAFFGLADATRETRTAMASLESSFAQSGHEMDSAYDTIYSLQGVLGDTDKAVEASNFLAKMSKDEADLAENTRILTGVYSLYKDSIPTEGLAEGMAATAAMGEVQGVLADALEWQGVNLEDFNAKLGELSSEEERAALIQSTLTGIYGEAADAYRENNSAMIEANEAQLRYDQSLAQLGATTEPITTSMKNGFADLLKQIQELTKDVDFEAIGDAIEGAFEWFGEEALPVLIQGVKDFAGWLKEAKTWVEENSGVLIAMGTAIGIVTTAYGAYNVVNGIKTAMDAVGATSIWGLVAAHWAQATAAMAAIAPYVLVVAAIAAVIAIIVLCIKYWDEIVEAVKKAWDAIVAAIQSAWDWMVGLFSSLATWFDENVIQPISNFFSGMWNGLKDGASAAWNGIKSVFSKVTGWFKDTFSKAWSAVKNVFSTGGKIFDGIKEGIADVFKTVVNGIIKGINKVISVPFNAINKILGKIRGVEIVGIKPFKWVKEFTVPEIPLLAEGGILTRPTLNIAGEAGPEAIIPIDKLEWFISGAVERAMQVVNLQALVYAIEDLANRPIELSVNGRRFMTATAGDSDSVNGQRTIFADRGLAL